jgi:hypothetical protein
MSLSAEAAAESEQQWLRSTFNAVLNRHDFYTSFVTAEARAESARHNVCGTIGRLE